MNKKSNLQDNLEYLKRTPRAFLVVFSCVDEPRTLNRISEEWEYPSNSALSQGGLRGELIRRGLVEVVDVKRGELLKSSVDWIFDYYERITLKETHWLGLIPDEIKKFINENKKTLYDLNVLKILLGNKERAIKQIDALITLPPFVYLIFSLKKFIQSWKIRRGTFDNALITAMSTINMMYNASLNVANYLKTIEPKIIDKIPPMTMKDFADFSKRVVEGFHA